MYLNRHFEMIDYDNMYVVMDEEDFKGIVDVDTGEIIWEFTLSGTYDEIKQYYDSTGRIPLISGFNSPKSNTIDINQLKKGIPNV